MKEDGDSITPPCIEPYMATFRLFLKNTEDKRIRDLQKANTKEKEKAKKTNSEDPTDW